MCDPVSIHAEQPHSRVASPRIRARWQQNAEESSDEGNVVCLLAEGPFPAPPNDWRRLSRPDATFSWGSPEGLQQGTALHPGQVAEHQWLVKQCREERQSIGGLSQHPAQTRPAAEVSVRGQRFSVNC